MIQAHNINSVSKNNFLSLMKLYEKNYYLVSKLINLEILNVNNLDKSFQSDPGTPSKKLLLSISSISKHTSTIKFSYNFFSQDIYINYVQLKIYFDFGISL